MTDQFAINALRESLIETREVALHLMATMDEVSLSHDLPTKFHGFGARANTAISIAEDRVRAAEKTPSDSLSSVLADLCTYRALQDEEHGGPNHDDTHTKQEWRKFIEKFTYKALCSLTDDDYQRNMLHVAALAVAAVQSSRRKALSHDHL